MKKLLSFIISATLVFGALPHMAFAAEAGGVGNGNNVSNEQDGSGNAGQVFTAVYKVTTNSSKVVCFYDSELDETVIMGEESGPYFIPLSAEEMIVEYSGAPYDSQTKTIDWTVEGAYDWDFCEKDDQYLSTQRINVNPDDYYSDKIWVELDKDSSEVTITAKVVDKPVPFEAVKGGSYKFQAVTNGNGIVTIEDEKDIEAFINTILMAEEQEKIALLELGPFAGIAHYNEDSFPLPEYIIQQVREGKTNEYIYDGSGSVDPTQEPSEYSTKIEIIRTPFAKDLEITADVSEYTWDDIEEDILRWSEEDTIPYFASLSFNAGTIARTYTVDLTKGSAKLSGEDALRSAVFMIATALAYDGYEKDENGSYIYEDQLENGFFWVDIDKDEETIDLYINLDDDAKGTYDICIDITAVVEYVKEQIKGKSMHEVDFFEIYANLPLTVEKTDECSVKDKAVLNFPKEVNKELIIEGVKVISEAFMGDEFDISDDYDDYAGTVLKYVNDFSFNTMTFVFKNNSTPSGGGGGRSGSVSFTLTYETNGGETIKSESHSAGDNVTLNKTPVKDGYTFTGWYADKECTQKIDSITMNSSKTVYAGWSSGAEVVDENAPLLVVTINETKYQLRGRNMEMDSAPFIDANDRTMLPVRVVANALGISDADIAWDNTTKTACFTRPDGKVVACTVGSNIIKIGDEEVEIDTAPVIRNDRIYLPMRALFNAFNVSDDHIAWDSAARKVTVAKEALDDINALTEAAPVEEEPAAETPAEEVPAEETPAEEVAVG